ncbi:MAG TPA: exo-alpha-sialidase [Candidatus Acidoferrum sp.]|nr:exo-alpha-sialidase [Candidatus Acidoferrum sp.]
MRQIFLYSFGLALFAFCPASTLAASADASLAAGLDPRVGLNLRLGNDPPQLPANMLAQAEPHIARHPSQPDVLVATFQEGRYTDAGAVDCGYSVSQDGGLSWTRALIPGLTTAVGGPYFRATDPVAGFDLQGRIYLNTLVALDSAFSTAAIVISRSTNFGATFEAPVEVTRSTTTAVTLDKNWMAINNFQSTPTAGRLVVTYTRFTSTADPIASSFSDDSGRTWSTPIFVTSPNAQCQGSQPVFLPSGKLAVVYWDFAPVDPTYEYIEVVTSTNGGASFTLSNLVAKVLRYSPPLMRNGVFLPSAAGNSTNDSLYVVYQALYQGQPRVLFTKSADAGLTWTAPIPASDNVANTPVFNPAISSSPDGQRLVSSFYDERVNPSSSNFVDLFLAQSLDGGATWQPNLRLTTTSSDVRLAPLTSAGYMLGDYLGIAAPNGPAVPAVAVWVDTRTGNPDPFITRVGVSSNITFQAWRAARFAQAQIAQPQLAGPGADPDGDGVVNALEYAFGLSPWVKDSPVFSFGFNTAGGYFAANYTRLRLTSDVSYSWLTSTNLQAWTALLAPETVLPDINPRFEDATANLGTNAGGTHFYRLGVTLH